MSDDGSGTDVIGVIDLKEMKLLFVLAKNAGWRQNPQNDNWRFTVAVRNHFESMLTEIELLRGDLAALADENQALKMSRTGGGGRLSSGAASWLDIKKECDRLRVIEQLARDFTADYDHEYEETCAHRFHALNAALDAKPE